MASAGPTENPYAAPDAVLVFAHDKELRAGARWHLAWLVVFGANLIVPLMFGSSLTRGAGQVGMVIAILLMLAAGHLACALSRTLAFVLVSGGVCVGLSQAMPILHFIAGIISQVITARLLHLPGDLFNDDRGWEVSTLPGGFLMTILTGAQLMIATLACGKLILFTESSWRKRSR